MNVRTAALLLAQRYPGGIEGLAPQVGKSGDTLRKELTGAPGYKLGVDTVEMVVALAQAAGVADSLAPIEAAALNAGATIVLLPVLEHPDCKPLALLAETAREFSEFVAVTAQAEADGSITANELKKIEREGGRLVGLVQRVLREVNAQHEAGKPNHLRAA